MTIDSDCRSWFSAADLLTQDASAPVAMLGAPMGLGSITPGRCNEAPEVVRAAMWVSGRCTSLGFTDPYCSSLFQRIPEYCASPERRAKVERP